MIFNFTGDSTTNVKEPYVFKTELCELFYKYGADKCPAIRHSYSPEYYTLLKEYKSQFTDILEIGVGNDCQLRYVFEYIPGASLRAWRDFFTDANVYGIDIDKCINNKKIEDYILEDRIEAVKKFKLNSTPTIIINKKKFDKPLNYKNLKKTLEKLI